MQIRCPTCRGHAAWDDNPHRPFCSERCQLIDLGRWATERYRVDLSEADGESPEAFTHESEHAPHHHGPQSRS